MWVLPSDTTAAEAARTHVRSALGRRGPIEDAELIASELAANAVVHGHPPVTLKLERGPRSVRISVTNRASGAEPEVQHPGTGQKDGRGLALVESVATGLGWYHDGAILTVWAEVAGPSTP